MQNATSIIDTWEGCLHTGKAINASALNEAKEKNNELLRA